MMYNKAIMEHNSSSSIQYNFIPELAFAAIEDHWSRWHANVNPACYVIGVSGGIDSTCVAALACKIFGKDKVVGVSLPCNGQADMEDVDRAFKFLGIRRITIDIGDMFMLGMNAIENQAIDMTDTCRTNMPARLRMAMLYGVAQCMNGIVLNTCQRSETVMGNDTLFGDDCGSYAPIQSLTKTEVKALATWLGVPSILVDKTPIDGLQSLSDEERLGVKYSVIDAYIRGTGPVSDEDRMKILKAFVRNKFKIEMVNISSPDFSHYPDAIRAQFGT